MQPRLAEFTRRDTRIHGMPTTAINAVKRPTINNIWLRRREISRLTTIVTRGNKSVCALMHRDSQYFAFRPSAGPSAQVGRGPGASVHFGTALVEAGAYADSMQPGSIQVMGLR